MKKRFTLDKANVERLFASLGVRPETRLHYRGYEIFIADCFTAKPGYDFQRFGVEHGTYPYGAYGTFWFYGRNEDHFDGGCCNHRDARGVEGHEGIFDPSEQRRLRITDAIRDARKMIDDRLRIRGEAA